MKIGEGRRIQGEIVRADDNSYSVHVSIGSVQAISVGGFGFDPLSEEWTQAIADAIASTLRYVIALPES